MSYIIRKTNGAVLGTILDGTVDNTHTSLTLVGRNYSNYGQIIADNLIKLTENFAFDIAPSNPLPGQLWWDTDTNTLKAWTGTTFKPISGAISSPVAPSTTNIGDMWWDTLNEQLYAYNGTTPYSALGWILIGPSYSKIKGKSGAIPEVIEDTRGTLHDVVTIYLNNVRTGIISEYGTFTPNVAISNFTTIQRGYNLNSTNLLHGTATNSTTLAGISASEYMRADIDNSVMGNLRMRNDSGIVIGVLPTLSLTVDSGTGKIANPSGGDISIQSSEVSALTINGQTGEVFVAVEPTTSMSIVPKQYVDAKFNDSVLTGIPVAPTAAAGTVTTQLATTEFVVNNSGFLKNKIYQGDSYLELIDTAAGSANLVIDGVSVLVATSSGVSLKLNATATTAQQTYNGTGNAEIATTQYVKTATQWWNGSAKFVSAAAPVASQGNNGDFWFQYNS